MGVRESLLNTITSVGNSDFVRIVTSAGASSKATVANLFKSFESGLSSKSGLTTSDYIRVVGSDNVSYKQLVSDVAKKIIEDYTGSSLAGSNRSVKAALDSLKSNMTIDTLQDCGSLTDISNALTTKLGTMTNNSIAQIRFAATATFAPFVSGLTYLGELRRTASTTYSCVIFYGLGARAMIFGYKTASGWSFASCTLT